MSSVKLLSNACQRHASAISTKVLFACHAYLLGKFNSYESAADNSDIFYRFQFLQDSVEIILILIDREYIFEFMSRNECRDDGKRACCDDELLITVCVIVFVVTVLLSLSIFTTVLCEVDFRICQHLVRDDVFAVQ